MKYLIAKNYSQGEDYSRRNGLKREDVKIIIRAEQLRGLRLAVADVILVGEWWDNQDIYNIKDLLPDIFKNE